MVTYKVLIIDEDISYTSPLRNYLLAQDNIKQVDIEADGKQAVDKLRHGAYDAVVLGLIVPGLDGLGILEQAGLMGIDMPAVIVTSNMRNESMIRAACAQGAQYFMAKPVDYATLYKRMMAVLCTNVMYSTVPTLAANMRTLDEKITSIFLVASIPAHIKGYHYLRKGIRMVYAQPTLINKITKELYPGIGKRFMTSPSKVERAIRHAIEVAWTRGKIENLNQLFGYNIYGKNDKPTNGEFIALVADKLLIEQGREQEFAGKMQVAQLA